jgi:hypothetical protein
MSESPIEAADTAMEELADFEPEELTLERVKELNDQKHMLLDLAYDGQFGFQVLMMHPTGHVQMASDINNLVQFWMDHQDWPLPTGER